MHSSIKKHISFSESLFNLAQIRARQFGITLAEYIRFLIMNDTKKIIEKEEYIDDKETLNSIERALKDEKEGNYIDLKTAKDIDEFVNSL